MATDKLELSEKAVGAIASSAERFIGYAYAGIFPLAILAFEAPQRVKPATESLGGILTAIIAFILGIGVYTVYSKVIGALLLFPVQHAIHYVADLILGKKREHRSSPVWLLHHYGVALKHSRTAYHKVRYQFFKGQDQTEIQVSHGELHVLYLSAVCLLTAYALLGHLGHTPSAFYIYIAGVVYFAALLGDTRQHAVEAAYLRGRSEEVITYLRTEGLL